MLLRIFFYRWIFVGGLPTSLRTTPRYSTTILVELRDIDVMTAEQSSPEADNHPY
jgi:hypothetical protein